MIQPQGKYNLELNFPGDGRIFLNFWDWAHGNDVVCEVKDGKLIRDGEFEIDFNQFLEDVINSINQRTI